MSKDKVAAFRPTSSLFRATFDARRATSGSVLVEVIAMGRSV
ncbi:MAG: hypothetical protein ACYSWO_30865 [Planctomycetota bacterium]